MDRPTLIESLLIRAAQDKSTSNSQSVIQFADGPLEAWQPFHASGEITVTSVSTIKDMIPKIQQSLAKQQPTIVLAPFTRFQSETERREVDSNLRGHLSVTEHLVGAIPKPPQGARLVTITPASVLESSGSAEFRELMCTKWHPAIVIEIDNHKIPLLRASFKLAVTAWTDSTGDNPLTKFFSVPSAETEANDILEDLEQLLGREGGRTESGFVLRQAIRPGAPLSVRANSPEARAHEKELDSFGLTRELTKVFQILRGRFSRDQNFTTGRTAGPGMLRLLGGRDILQDGTIADSEDETRWVESIDTAPPLQLGDLVFREILSPKHRKLICARYSELDDPAALGPGLVALRPREHASAEAVSIARAYLGSEHCKALHDMTASSLSGHVRLNLRDIRLPQPDAALATAVHEIEIARERFESWQTVAKDVISSAFMQKTPTSAYAHIIATGRTLRLRAEAALAISDFSTIIRTRFPHPLSYRWRTVEANLSAGEPQQAYNEILEAAEVLLCFLAHVSLAAARDVRRPIGAMASVTEKLSSQRSGPGFGDWLTILAEVKQSRSLRSGISEQHILHDIAGFLGHDDVEQAVRSIKARRDDYAHLRRPPTQALEREIQESFRDLRKLFSAALFLAETPLHAVDATAWDSIAGQATARSRDLVGDHPVVPTRTLITESQLDSGSLHIGTNTGLILLRPYLIGCACPDCGHWSTFHADRFDGAAMSLKSLERGHIMSDTSQVTAFHSSGLLA